MTAPAWKRWQCSVCGEVYDEAVGDADAGIPAGTRFEDLPEDWICPSCGSGKSAFRLLAD